MGVIMGYDEPEKSRELTSGLQSWQPENTVEIHPQNVLSIVEKICVNCRYPFLALRLYIHIICGIDNDSRIHISARHHSKKLDVHYDTVTKCLKYLREIGAIGVEERKATNAATYYGKKTYFVHSSIARKAATKEHLPDYTN
jgi:hypothetical protein